MLHGVTTTLSYLSLTMCELKVLLDEQPIRHDPQSMTDFIDTRDTH